MGFDSYDNVLRYLYLNYPDNRVNNNKYIIGNENEEIKEHFRFLSMKQSVFKNIQYVDGLFENVALTGSTFENVKFKNTKLIGNSFANSYFYNTEIYGTRSYFSGNNFSQSSFEQCFLYNVKLIRSGVLNSVYHRCNIINSKFRGSTFEGTQFIDCTFDNCDFSNLNIDYTLFSKNTFRKIIFPFYQIAYIIGAADFITDENQIVCAKAGDKVVSAKEYFSQSDKLILYYLDKKEYFPVCNLLIAKHMYVQAKEYLLTGINDEIENKNFRMISNYCRLAKYHNIVDEALKQKIIELMDNFAKSDSMPESQINSYLTYIGNIKNILNEGARSTVTLNYVIRTNTNKYDEKGVEYVNNLVNELNRELSSKENIQGFEVKITNHSPFEIAIAIITLLSALPASIDSVMNIITKIKTKGEYELVDPDAYKKNIGLEIENLKLKISELHEKYSGEELNNRISEVTQTLQTDLEELYDKDIMIYKIKKRTK